MTIVGVGVEHVEKRLLSEAADLLLDGLCVTHSVALRKSILGLNRAGWGMIEERPLLLGEFPVTSPVSEKKETTC